MDEFIKCDNECIFTKSNNECISPGILHVLKNLTHSFVDSFTHPFIYQFTKHFDKFNTKWTHFIHFLQMFKHSIHHFHSPVILCEWIHLFTDSFIYSFIYSWKNRRTPNDQHHIATYPTLVSRLHKSSFSLIITCMHNAFQRKSLLKHLTYAYSEIASDVSLLINNCREKKKTTTQKGITIYRMHILYLYLHLMYNTVNSNCHTRELSFIVRYYDVPNTVKAPNRKHI